MGSFPLAFGIAVAWVPLAVLATGVLLSDRAVSVSSPALLIAFVLGLLYTHFFEYLYHRYPMHRYYRSALLDHIKNAHNEHHRAFPGSRPQLAPERLLESFKKMSGETVRMNDMVAQRWWVFPVIQTMHAFVLLNLLERGIVISFLFGTVVHFSLYEMSHWFTHISPTRFDAAVRRLPLIGNVWRLSVQVHMVHHREPTKDYNFIPPWLGDMFGGTFATHQSPRTKEPGPT